MLNYLRNLTRIFHGISVPIAASSSWALRLSRLKSFFHCNNLHEMDSFKNHFNRLTSLRTSDLTTKSHEICGLRLLFSSILLFALIFQSAKLYASIDSANAPQCRSLFSNKISLASRAAFLLSLQEKSSWRESAFSTEAMDFISSEEFLLTIERLAQLQIEISNSVVGDYQSSAKVSAVSEGLSSALNKKLEMDFWAKLNDLLKIAAPFGITKEDLKSLVKLEISLVRSQEDQKNPEKLLIKDRSQEEKNLIKNVEKTIQSFEQDPYFRNGIIFNQPVYAMAVQKDGKVLLGGEFTSYINKPNSIKEKSYNRMIRLNKDGNLDPSFSTGSLIPNGRVYSIKVLNDGKILISGSFIFSYNLFTLLQKYLYNYLGKYFKSFNKKSYNNGLILLSKDGMRDSDFYTGDGFDGFVNAMEVQRDGKIIVGGAFEYYNYEAHVALIRLNRDGSVDPQFIKGEGFESSNKSNKNISSIVNAIAVQSDGKILVGGYFFTFNGSSVRHLVRLNEDGSMDPHFKIDLGFVNGAVTVVKVEENDSIIVGGNFDSYDSIPCNAWVRLDKNGGPHPYIQNNSQYYLDYIKKIHFEQVTSIEIQSDGKFIISGWYNGDSYYRYHTGIIFRYGSWP